MIKIGMIVSSEDASEGMIMAMGMVRVKNIGKIRIISGSLSVKEKQNGKR